MPEQNTPRSIQEYDVPHGATYYQKWEPVMRRNREEFVKFVNFFVQIVKQSPMVPKFVLYYIENYSQKYPYHPEMMEEMSAISILSGVKFSDIFLLNVVYELFSHKDACTSIVVRNNKGQFFQSRDLDYDMQKQYAQIAIQFNYFDENKVKIYSSSQFVGYVIVHTGIRHGAYSLSLNQRTKGSGTLNISQFLKGAYPDEWLVTEVLKTKTTYSEAVKALSNTEIIASCYYILAGIKGNEGIIIERDREGTYKSYELDEKTWFLVATNSDQDEKDPDTRRTEAQRKLKQIGPGISQDDLQNQVLTQYPNLNYFTIETIMLNPQEKYIDCQKWW